MNVRLFFIFLIIVQKFTDANTLEDGFEPMPEIPMQESFPEMYQQPQQVPPQVFGSPDIRPSVPTQPSFRPPVMTTEDDTEDQLLRQAIEESLKSHGQGSTSLPSTTTVAPQKTEDELLQEAIKASLEGHHMQEDEDDEIMRQIQEQSQREHEANLQKEQEEKKKLQTPDIAYLNKVDSYVIGDQDKTTDSSLVTRVQLRLPSGKREVIKVLKTTPLTVMYALVRKKLAAETESGDPTQVPPFNVVNVNKPLENVADKTLADANALGSSLMVAFE
jgi:hypothetical protein